MEAGYRTFRRYALCDNICVFLCDHLFATTEMVSKWSAAHCVDGASPHDVYCALGRLRDRGKIVQLRTKLESWWHLCDLDCADSADQIIRSFEHTRDVDDF